MRLGLLGGTFDPVHYGHLLLAECCLEQCPLDAVWFLPAAVPPHKQQRERSPAQARVEMIELAVAGHPAFSVSRYEADQGRVCYTADTLAHFREEDAGRELFFLMGADMLRDLPTWRQPERVCQLATLVVAHRPGAGEPAFEQLARIASPERIERFRRQRVEMPEIGLSSSEIRRRVAGGKSIRYQTPKAVEQYIRAHGLYASVPPASTSADPP
jgi:nicotinate-nucleotide adenylyltransferase